jgi:thiosulfate/3-mercaptopyruvate sulfurtransferase
MTDRTIASIRTGPLLVLLVTGLVAWPVATPAQQARDDLLVTVDWLADHLDDGGLVLLHVGQEDHIPGARFVHQDQLAAPEDHEGMTGLNLQMPDPASLESVLEGLGISDDSRIVVYYGDDWVSSSTRILLTLDWIGLGGQIALLDGGMGLWKARGHEVTAEPPPPARQGSLTPRVRESLIVSAEWVRDHLDDDAYRVVDARAPVHYDGIQATNLHREPVRKGHIPGAVNVPFNQLWDDSLRLRPADELTRIFEDAGLRAGQTVVGYCHLGQYATAMIFGARTLGYDVRLYDGSFQEWGSREELPIEGPEG